MAKSIGVARRHLILAGATALVLVFVPMTAGTPVNATTPGSPTVVQRGTLVYADNFDVAPGAAPMGLQDYGTPPSADPRANGQTYAADVDWLPSFGGCNGWVLNSTSPSPNAGGTVRDASCDTMDGGLDGLGQQHTAWWFLQQMAVALGQRQITEDEPGSDAPGYAANNYAVSSESNSHATESESIQFQSQADSNGDYATQGIKGHYYEVAIYIAQVHCATPGRAWTDAEEQLNLLWHNSTGSNTVRVLPTDSSAGYNICTSGSTVTLANSTPAHTAYLVSEPFQLPQDATIGLQLLNNQSDPTGNDVAFDLPQIIDVTPQIDKSFSPTVIAQGGVSQLTFTVTNASGIAPAAPGGSELAAKTGWGFTDTMPPDLKVASTPNIVTDCGDPSIVSINAARDTITVTNGSLAAGDPGYCTIKLDVTTNVPGTYVNGTSTGGPNNADGNNITSIFGLNPPGDATLTDAPTSLTLAKTANRDVVSADGQQVTYTFAVTNTSLVPVTDLKIDEKAFNGTGDATALDDPTCLATTLAPGASTICTATYSTTQDDIDTLTSLTNTAQASGLANGNAEPNRTLSNESTATVAVEVGPHLSIRKSVTPASGGAKGTELTYTFTIMNDGNESLTNVGIDETAFTGTNAISAITCDGSQVNGEISLAPEESINCTATYTVTQQDVYAGLVDNTAAATGKDPSNADVTSNPASAEALLDQASSISITKTHLAPADPANAGDKVKFTFTVTNTGESALHSIAIADTLPGLSAPVCPGTGQSWPGTVTGQLLPNQSVTCDATYTLKQADVDAGKVVNPSAIASGIPAGQTEPVTSGPAHDTIPLPAHPGLSIVKSASPTDPADFVAGQVITYTFAITNTGNVTVSGLGVVETAFDGSGSITGLTCPTTPLAPGASTTCTATYTLTDADIEQGSITNTAEATGKDQGGGDVTSDPDSVTLPEDPEPGLSLVKIGTLVNDSEIDYSFTATNTGNTVLNNVTIAEGTFNGHGTRPVITCDGTAPITLWPGETLKCTAVYQVVESDDGTTILNDASATGDPPSHAPLIAQSEATNKVPADTTPTGDNAQTGGTVLGSAVLPDGLAIGASLTGAAIIVLLALVWASATANSSPRKQPKQP